MGYDVRVTRVNESEHKADEENFKDVSEVTILDGSVSIRTEDGRAAGFGATTWGSVTVVRVPGR
ncbi:MAG: hypothetical protein AAF092_12595 [Pseudomonadota bacterium]